MEELDLDQPAIVFWMHHPGELTRFDRLEDAVHSVMLEPSAKLFAVAWIKARDAISRWKRLGEFSDYLFWQATCHDPAGPTTKFPLPCHDGHSLTPRDDAHGP